MLVLQRKVDGVIEIHHAGETLRLVVCHFDGRGVRLGFDGPRSFVVVRDDIKAGPPAGVFGGDEAA